LKLLFDQNLSPFLVELLAGFRRAAKGRLDTPRELLYQNGRGNPAPALRRDTATLSRP
jgi:hypothetical protein